MDMTGISLHSVNTIYLKIRRRLANSFELAIPLNGSAEASESYFGGYRSHGRPGHGAYGKTDLPNHEKGFR